VLRYRQHERELFGGEPQTTNNRMELMAAIKALEALHKPCAVRICTDSQYLLKGITEWLPNWIRRNWITAARTPVKNEDLWRQLMRAQQPHRVEWEWVKGHSGHPENERADRLANRGIDELAACIDVNKG
jgi:ribonuclease HI